MKILYITNLYPCKEKPYYGIFVKEQIDSLYKYASISYDVYFIKGFKSWVYYLKSVFYIPALLIFKRYDVVHVHYGLSGLFLFFFPFFNKKVVLTLHSGEILSEKKKYIQIFITKIILKRVAHVIILSDQMEGIIKKYTNRYSIIPCGVDTAIFNYKPSSIKSDKKNEYILLFPSEPTRYIKNFPLFKSVIDLLITHYNLKISYKCIQNLTRYEIAALMNEADCLLMTSFAEGSPQVVKEALACGLPVVSTNIGDVESLLAGIPSCFISNQFDLKNIAKLVYDCLILGPDRINIRNIFLLKKIDLDSIAQKIFLVYKKNI